MKIRRPLRFSSLLVLTFSVLSLPILILVLSIAYIKSAASIREVLKFDTERAQASTIHTVTEFFTGSIGLVHGLAELEQTRPHFRAGDEGAMVLRSSLVAAHHLDGVYVIFEDGYVRGATRIDAQRRSNQPEIPAEAVWHSYEIEPAPPGNPRVRHQTFYEDSLQPIGNLTNLAPYDNRQLPNYIGAKETRRTFIAKTTVNPGTGGMIIPIAAPIIRDGKFIGAVGANFTTIELATFLEKNRITPRSVSTIIDADGNVLAPPVLSEMTTDPLLFQRVEEVQEMLRIKLNEAILALKEHDLAAKMLNTRIVGVPSVVSIFDIPNSFGISWKGLTIIPEADFVGPLNQTHRLIGWILTGLIPIEIILILVLAKRISRGIEEISRQVAHIRNMNFETPELGGYRYPIKEVQDLYQGVGLLRSALASFAQYIPIGVVKHLIESGKPLTLGVEKKTLSVMFSDIENFSTFAQQHDSDEVLATLSQFLLLSTDAITAESGTVDKFIGDSVMAFWGAPSEVPHHALRACRAALRITRRLEKQNERWRAEGRPTIRARLGLHFSEVLVGNIGSTDRLSYTVIGDGVNVASRLEGVNKQFGTSICISDTIYSQVAHVAVARPLGNISVKGRSGEFMVYELIGLKDSNDPELAAPSVDVQTEEAVPA